MFHWQKNLYDYVVAEMQKITPIIKKDRKSEEIVADWRWYMTQLEDLRIPEQCLRRFEDLLTVGKAFMHWRTASQWERT
jgi:hypothetical protein